MFHTEEEIIARLTDIAYQAVLKQGISKPFLDVELELWREIRDAYQEQAAEPDTYAHVA